MWNAAKNEPGPYAFTIDHLQTLMDYDLEFEPAPKIFDAIDYLEPKASPRRPVQVYREAIRTNNPDMLEVAKRGLKETFKRYYR